MFEEPHRHEKTHRTPLPIVVPRFDERPAASWFTRIHNHFLKGLFSWAGFRQTGITSESEA